MPVCLNAGTIIKASRRESRAMGEAVLSFFGMQNGRMSRSVLLLLLVVSRIIAGMTACDGGERESAPPLTPTPELTPTPVPDQETDEVVIFPDSCLEMRVRKAIEKPTGDIYRSDLEKITTLDGSICNIKDLTGLEYCVNLAELTLHSNLVTDISPLANLTAMRGLNLQDNRIEDISALAGLTNLNRLYLTKNRISDISPLVENTGLSEGDTVDLKENPLSTTSLSDYITLLFQRGIKLRW